MYTKAQLFVYSFAGAIYKPYKIVGEAAVFR
jgi:hypothetical protein